MAVTKIKSGFITCINHSFISQINALLKVFRRKKCNNEERENTNRRTKIKEKTEYRVVAAIYQPNKALSLNLKKQKCKKEEEKTQTKK